MLKIVLLLFVVAACDACSKKHCPGLGTFFKKGPYKHWLLPDCPDKLDVKMHLYTRSNQNSGKVISASTIPSYFRSGQRTIFIAHGFWHANKWFPDMKNALLTKGNFNVITVDWDSKSLYSKAASNTRTVGAAVAQVARYLVANNRITRQKLWCMGQSLGAHVCGNAGKKYRFGRVTGLDPAGPKFKDNAAAGLIPGSADYVDVIHTGASFFGMMTPVGHVDFYPNGGKQQPGCKRFIGRQWCNHRSALKFFIDTIYGRSTCYTYSKCSSTSNIPGSCHASTKQQLGYYSDIRSGRGLYYLRTRASSPYC